MPINSRKQRSVVVTGMGAVTPIGQAVETYWANLCAGQSGVQPISLFDASPFRTRIAAEVRDLMLPPPLEHRHTRRMDRFALFGLVAALEAWNDSRLAHAQVDPYDIGVIIGSSHGGETSLFAETTQIIEGKPQRVSPRFITRMLSNMASAQVAIHLNLRGPSFTIASACGTSAHAIGEAAEIIRRGDATVMLCGGAEACITPITLAGDQSAGALSTRNDEPARASRPFDVERDGFVLGEGAGVLVLEELEHALRRDAPIYAELSGYGTTSDAMHETQPDADGTHAARAISRALAKADIAPHEVSAIFAHATSTTLGDRAEARALALAFGDALPSVPVTAIKSVLGHLLGAAGAVQAIAAIKALNTQKLPAILNLEAPDPACPLNFVMGEMQPVPCLHAISNSFGFGGHNVSLAFSLV